MTATSKTVHVISHTHWDREWYMPYEAHHVKLIETMDTLLDTFEADPDFRSFYLDGQTIVVDDYLQIYPEKRERIQRLCDEGKLFLGPWYILQDEFLTSGEANVRNLQIGHREAAAFGRISKLGYFPDSFGNMGQAAQLLRQAGIGTAVFGRGVKATGFNNRVEDSSGLTSPYSELIWQSPDGSAVLGILFANWYNNGMEIPTDPERAKAYWDVRLKRAEQYASTSHLLFMNGCDHQPVQTNLSEALRVARELYPEYTFVHSSFEEYLEALRPELPADLSVTAGELRGQRTDGWYTLVNTASARVYVKQMNARNQTLLERIAEPLAAIAHSLGKPYPHAQLQYAWKTLMQNHPHDSICGCSVDEVYHEMATRFAKSMEVAKAVAAESASYIASGIDTSAFASFGDGAAPFAAFNTSGYEGSSVVTVEVEWSRRYFDQSENPAAVMKEVRDRTLPGGYLVNARGERIDCEAVDLGVRFGYDLPKDRFRQPYMARAVRLTFETEALPAMGYASYAWISGAVGEPPEAAPGHGADGSLVIGDRALDNGRLRVTVGEDGRFSLLDHRTGQQYDNLGEYEDVGDIGNEYIFKQPEGDTPYSTAWRSADIRVVLDTPFQAAIEISNELLVPASADERLAEEVAAMIEFRQRKAKRSEKFVPLRIVTRVSLDRSGLGVQVRARIDNRSKDHRLRVLLPTGVNSEVHYADSVFEVAERANQPEAEWQNPSNCQHMSAFVGVHAEGRGLTVATKGLNEYEVLQDGRNTIAVTLLRSVGELGDWGVFPTPEAQCLGEQEAEWMIIPHAGLEDRTEAYREAYRYTVPATAAGTGVHGGTLPGEADFLPWSGEGLAFSNLKVAEATGDRVARWYNLTGEPVTLAVHPDAAAVLYKSDILESAGGEKASGVLPVCGCEIVTLGLKGGNVWSRSL
ncbi:alpha-mannosidase [Paenibacillus sp. LHD-117]|uniref:alpha-mannosidase n=1 Tax=Paenibacillus sp. LHD-117 TaxID=3071412 RepID=UPI0027E04D2D|nr:alpha-mannosidase [Paenibacillus sp. LHD-117]MDQ6419030.1 alpha-mannosidase [Paenibacillus sp. LHD-117]